MIDFILSHHDIREVQHRSTSTRKSIHCLEGRLYHLISAFPLEASYSFLVVDHWHLRYERFHLARLQLGRSDQRRQPGVRRLRLPKGICCSCSCSSELLISDRASSMKLCLNCTVQLSDHNSSPSEPRIRRVRTLQDPRDGTSKHTS